MDLLTLNPFRFYFPILILILTSACATVVRLPSNHFMGPAVQAKSWAGEINATVGSATELTLVNDITTNPPTRTKVLVNANSNGPTLGTYSANVHLSVLPQFEINYDSYLYGIKWQLIGKDQGFVAAIQAAGGTKSDSSSNSTNSSSSETKTTSTEGGLSIGYLNAGWAAPYLTFIYEDHQSTTTIKNTGGTFNFTDSGIHRNTSLGVMKMSTGFSFALEATYIDIAWNRGGVSSQTACGAIFGFRW